MMDSKLNEKMNQKISEIIENSEEIFHMIKSLELDANADSLAYGIVIGRLYNSFNYQCRRILKRNPTKQEFSEFIEFLRKKQKDLYEMIRTK